MLQAVIINNILYVLGAYLMGFFAAVPIGASQLEIAKRSLNGYLYSAMMIGVGTTLSDGMYGAIAFFGIAPFLNDPFIIAVFRSVNSVILVILGIWAIRGSKYNPEKNDSSVALLKKRSVAFFTGFSLALTNPMIMLWWLIGHSFLSGTGLVDNENHIYIYVFLASGIAGILSYALVLSLGVYKSKKFFSDKSVRKITRSFGYALLSLAVYFAYLSYLTFNAK
jgi:threonine/homoserine/homoserine lactone efflux protein